MSATSDFECAIPADWAEDFSQCLYEWQSLEGGALALLAAFIGAKLLRRQIGQAQEHRQDDINRRHRAAKITMPLTLSSVSNLTQVIADEIASELETYGPEGVERTLDAILNGSPLRKAFQAAQISDSVISSFENFVETLDNPHDVKHVSELIAQLQILVSRFNGIELDDVGSRSNLESLLINAAIVKVLNDNIFNYARNVDHSAFGIVGLTPDVIAWRRIKAAAHGLVFARKSPDHFFPAINRLIEEHIEHGSTPWLEKFAA